MVFISAQIRRKEFGRKVPAEDLPAFRAALDKHLALLEADIADGDIEELIAIDD
jgi:hypothetical protein